MDAASPVASSKQQALARRYGDGAPPARGPWNEHLDLLLSHRSVRGYRPDPLPDGTLETLIAAAQSAATSSNMQVWSVVAVTDADAKAVLAEVAGGQAHIEQCPLFLVWLADLSRNRRLGEAEGTELAALPFTETFLVAAIDAALAAQNAAVALESLGLSTVYIGALRNDPARVAGLLDLPPGAFAVFGMCVGYAAAGAEGEVKPRLPQPAVLFRGTYGNPEEPALRAAYDARLADFSRRNEMADATWTSRVLARMGTLAAMRGRDRLRETLQGLGFPMR